MKKIVITLAAAVVSMSAFGAQAGGWGSNSGSNSLITISPKVGDITALNGVLSGNAILSGNNVSDILTKNTTSILNGNVLGILGGGNSYKVNKKH